MRNHGNINLVSNLRASTILTERRKPQNNEFSDRKLPEITIPFSENDFWNFLLIATLMFSAFSFHLKHPFHLNLNIAYSQQQVDLQGLKSRCRDRFNHKT